MAELGERYGRKMTDGLGYKEELLVDYALFCGGPTELLQDGCYVTDVGGSSHDTGCRVLHFDLQIRGCDSPLSTKAVDV